MHGRKEHPARAVILRELHARPPEAIAGPALITRIVTLVGEQESAALRDFVAHLCAILGVQSPHDESDFFVANTPELRFRYERHTELAAFTFARAPSAQTTPFAASAIDALSPHALFSAPGELLVALHLDIRSVTNAEDAAAIAGFDQAKLAAGTTHGGAIAFASDFETDRHGFTRILLGVNPEVSAAATGRVVQKLLEIETYRTAALLAFPVAKETRATLSTLERAVSDTMADVASEASRTGERDLLERLSDISARAEALANATTFRFTAARAYHRLVQERLDLLAETPIADIPTFAAFMARRLAPAMRTCDSTSARQDALLARIARATTLLTTRVQVKTEEQNAGLLASMEKRARLQVRLQETVEGLSVIAITYYAIGLLAYLAKAGVKMGLPVSADVATGVAVAPILAIVWYFLREQKKRLHAQSHEDEHR